MSALQGPKKTAAGYFLALTPPVHAPELRFVGGTWKQTAEWNSWATEQRSTLLTNLLAKPAWFSRPPRADILNPIFGPWSTETSFLAEVPNAPGTGSGQAIWTLDGLLMSATAIKPVWSVQAITADEEEDKISFGSASVASEAPEDTREIQLEEIEDGPPAIPTRIRNREWEAKKFLAKERVREARLKAQIADRIAMKEERRYYTQFGDLDDGESHFSEYDLTENEESESESDSAQDV